MNRHHTVDEVVRTPANDPWEAPRRPARRRVQLAAVAAGVVAAVFLLLHASTGALDPRSQSSPLAAHSIQPGQQTPSPKQQGDVFGTGTGVTFSCAWEYSARTLATRAFAFDGTVVDIGKLPAVNGETAIDVPVTFEVTQWFRGGQGGHVTVSMLPPSKLSTVDNPTYAVGSRLLVSGGPRWGGAPLADPVAWACGFTRWYSQADARMWSQTLH